MIGIRKGRFGKLACLVASFTLCTLLISIPTICIADSEKKLAKTTTRTVPQGGTDWGNWVGWALEAKFFYDDNKETIDSAAIATATAIADAARWAVSKGQKALNNKEDKPKSE